MSKRRLLPLWEGAEVLGWRCDSGYCPEVTSVMEVTEEKIGPPHAQRKMTTWERTGDLAIRETLNPRHTLVVSAEVFGSYIRGLQGGPEVVKPLLVGTASGPGEIAVHGGALVVPPESYDGFVRHAEAGGYDRFLPNVFSAAAAQA